MADKPVITIKEVKFGIKACADAARRAQEADAADEIKKAAIMGVFERLLGVKTAAEVAAMSPDDIAKVAKARVRRGDVTLEGFELDLLLKVIKQSACRRNVAWKDAFVSMLGESEAAKVMNQAPQSYSYKFVEVA